MIKYEFHSDDSAPLDAIVTGIRDGEIPGMLVERTTSAMDSLALSREKAEAAAASAFDTDERREQFARLTRIWKRWSSARTPERVAAELRDVVDTMTENAVWLWFLHDEHQDAGDFANAVSRISKSRSRATKFPAPTSRSKAQFSFNYDSLLLDVVPALRRRTPSSAPAQIQDIPRHCEGRSRAPTGARGGGGRSGGARRGGGRGGGDSEDGGGSDGEGPSRRRKFLAKIAIGLIAPVCAIIGLVHELNGSSPSNVTVNIGTRPAIVQQAPSAAGTHRDTGSARQAISK